MRDAAIVEIVERHATPIDLESAGQRLIEAIDPGVSLVLIGEATHGTHEFYRIRADLTRAFIQHRGFTCVAAEADWPDAYRANRWVRLLGDDRTAEEALSDFTRFPRWIWRNREVVRFLRWLRAENADRSANARAGFYGLDLYSLAPVDGARHRVSGQGRPGGRRAGASRLCLLRRVWRQRAVVRVRRESQPRTLV